MSSKIRSSEDSDEWVDEDGCCCSIGTEPCCSSPDVHKMSESEEELGDDSWSFECHNCGKICRCDV